MRRARGATPRGRAGAGAAARALGVALASALALAAAAALASDKGLWFDFKPHPKARLLCTEVVSGTAHITWRSLAIADGVPAVVAFYEEAEHTKATKGPHGSWDLGAAADPARERMTILPAAAVEKFPHCAVRPKKDEPTVIVISEKTGP